MAKPKQKFQINAYYVFDFEKGVTGVTAKTRLMCTKRGNARVLAFENARKKKEILPKEGSRYSQQKYRGLYATFPQPLWAKSHGGIFAHHTFCLGNSTTGIFDPKNSKKYSYGDLGTHAIIFLFSDDFRYDITGKTIESGTVEIAIFRNQKDFAPEIYESAINGELEEEFARMRKIAIIDK